MKHLNITISEDRLAFVEKLRRELPKMSRSCAIDLVLDAAQGNLGIHLVKHHFHNGFSRADKRKKERAH